MNTNTNTPNPFDDDAAGDDRRTTNGGAAQDDATRGDAGAGNTRGSGTGRGTGRTGRSAAPEVRGELGVSQDIERTGEALSDDEFELMLQNDFDDSRLPKVPEIPGYHCCWLTTSSPYDPLPKRHKLGYTPVRRADVPGYTGSDVAQMAGFEDVVTCNEMVLHKIPMARYQMLMAHYHHRKPLEDESATIDKIKDGNKQTSDRSGRALGSAEGDGLSTLEQNVERGRRVKVPMFE